MESNFNNPFGSPPAGPPSPDVPAAPAPDPTAEGSAALEGSGAPATEEVTLTPGLSRFRTCRWQQPAEDGREEFCTHREVKPYAGATNFDANAWCPDCVHYKLRRTPKKRSQDDYGY